MVSILVVSFLDATASLVDSFINREIRSCSVIQGFSNWKWPSCGMEKIWGASITKPITRVEVG